eukprot:1161969-Pelagomonas_calceolata.AAC.5
MRAACHCRYQVEREMRIHIQLDHVNIIKLYAAFEDDKNVYMVQSLRTSAPPLQSFACMPSGAQRGLAIVQKLVAPLDTCDST